MGLDNGINLISRFSVKDRFEKLWKHYFPEYTMPNLDERFYETKEVYSLGEGKWIEVPYPHYALEIAYWRKCWNIRELAYETMDINDDNVSVQISTDDAQNFVLALSEKNDPDVWDDDFCSNRTIWDSTCIFRDSTRENSDIARDMRMIAIAAHIVEEDEDNGEYTSYLEFYDSF